MNISIEGMMLIGALFGFMVSTATGSAWLGVLGACAAGMVFSLIHALLTVGFGMNQVISGLAPNYLGTGLSSVLGSQFVGRTAAGFSQVPLGFLSKSPS